MTAQSGDGETPDKRPDAAGLTVVGWDLPLSGEGVVLACRGGGRIRVRPIRGSDRAALIESFAGLSPESRYRRFFTRMNELPERWADRLTSLDHSLHRAWVVFDADAESAGAEERGIAVARLISQPDHPDSAELAMAVVDDHQGRGIGRALMELLLSTAAVNGISVIRADTMRENKAMIRLLRSNGAVAVGGRSDGDVVSHDLVVPEFDETTGALYDLIRHSA